MQNKSKKDTFIVLAESTGLRIDNFLSEKVPGKSRNHLQKLIMSSFVKVNNASVSKSHKLSLGDIVDITDQDTLEHEFSGIIKPQDMPLKILYEDDYYLIISKDAGISVHPSPGRYENTLVNALLFYFKNNDKNYPAIMDRIDTAGGMEDLGSAGSSCEDDLDKGTDSIDSTRSIDGGINADEHTTDNLGSSESFKGMHTTTECAYDKQSIESRMRPGIIHRLDKDTSGLIIVAKNSNSQYRMSELFKNRQVKKTYLALVVGSFSEKKGTIDLPVGRSRIDRKKMAVSIDTGRNAFTDFEIRENFTECTLVNAYPKTGRTHQIRVHFSYIDHPIVGDKTYGNSESAKIGKALGLNRQFLHAQKLSFCHPFTKKMVEIEDEPAQDLIKSLGILRQQNRQFSSPM